MKRTMTILMYSVCIGAAALAACSSSATNPTPSKMLTQRTILPDTQPTPVTITVDAGAAGALVHDTTRGANFAAWYDITRPGIACDAKGDGLRFERWPGG